MTRAAALDEGPGRIAAWWHAAASLLARHRDVLDARPDEGDIPPALARRGWAGYLLALDDAALDRIEAAGVDAAWPEGAPASLVELVTGVRDVCSVAPSPFAAGEELPRRRRRFETPRKHAQIDAFARAVLPLAAGAKRVVDVGSGHGHLTRALAERLGVPVLGLERDEALAGTARALARHGAASFAVTDVLASGLTFGPGDCVVGLHACGELGDAMVLSAARAGAALALVGCCLQKRRSIAREPLFPGGALAEADRGALDLPRSILGLSNLTARDEAVETSRANNLAARERRLALHRLLAESGVPLPLGAEIAGLNRRAAQAELDVLVTRAFAVRQLAPPSGVAIASAARWAATHHARMRRLALPRSLLGRALEVFVLLDRGACLEARDYEVTVSVLFPGSVSARNLMLCARPRAGRTAA
ncbi:MAG: hypothetical protein JWP97_6491 [Labilithrix sp.]|nr:hypothetical protein [Labilithrix sp.]